MCLGRGKSLPGPDDGGAHLGGGGDLDARRWSSASMSQSHGIPACVRSARPADVAVLTALAHAAKRHWGYPGAWIDAWREQLTETPAYLQEWTVRVAVRNGDTVGFYAIKENGAAAELEHLWVRRRHMGRAVGRGPCEHAVRRARLGSARGSYVESDPRAVGFPERLGATRDGTVPASVTGVPPKLPRVRLELDSGA
jgi:hypothetical protein